MTDTRSGQLSSVLVLTDWEQPPELISQGGAWGWVADTKSSCAAKRVRSWSWKGQGGSPSSDPSLPPALPEPGDVLTHSIAVSKSKAVSAQSYENAMPMFLFLDYIFPTSKNQQGYGFTSLKSFI